MPDLDLNELDLDRDPLTPPEPEGPPVGKIVAGIAVAALVGALGYFGYRALRGASPPEAAAVQPTPPPPPPTMPSPSLPPLGESDAFIRDLLGALSPDPRWTAWLQEPSLVRRLATVVDGLAEGELPVPALKPLAPKGAFSVRRRAGATVIDAKSYERYDGVAEVVASLDGASCARVLRLVTPLAEEAYKSLGHPQGGFATALDAALSELLTVEVPDDPVRVTRVERARTTYAFADPELEKLSAAQKALLRMGPANARRVQSKLTELRAGLQSSPQGTPQASPSTP